MDDQLLVINKAQFGYADKVVLEVEHLCLERGNLYFLIGKSGIGKSTLLEGLGLMNNTILSSSKSVNYFDKNEIHLKDLWTKDSDSIAEFRRKNYSFIFQENNLMSNFTAGINMSFTGMINGLSDDKIKTKILKLMDEIDLDHEVYDMLVQNLSGGQRQRLSFIRSFLPAFEILFADEPTGNLDLGTSDSLMQVMKSHIADSNKVALIVTHDISSALKFGDKIFYITEDEDLIKGVLKKENILISDGKEWKNGVEKVKSPEQYLRNICFN